MSLITILQVRDNVVTRQPVSPNTPIRIIARVSPAQTGNSVSLSFYSRLKGWSNPSNLEGYVNHWIRITWSLPQNPSSEATTWHRITPTDSEIQFMTCEHLRPLREVIFLSQILCQESKPKPSASPKSSIGQFPRVQIANKRAHSAGQQRRAQSGAGIAKRCFSPPTYASRGQGSPYRTRNPLRGIPSDQSSQPSQTAPWERSDQPSVVHTVASSVEDPEIQVDGQSIALRHKPGFHGDTVPPSQDLWVNAEDERKSLKLLNPPSESRANRDAVSPECEHLLQKAILDGYLPDEPDEDDDEDAFWSWSQEQQQFFHINGETQSIIWFPRV
ncbi:hypothetical protein F4778DRAFT_536092 [Xylariomycetidae sp. FL2044]|nr:hypothetical protein F4778DRAFT_536092 [Xylariomycetidae sp. FL2044]